MEPIVSIIVPIYNVELYVERCLNSLTQQTYQNIEIIVVNDGSTDNSLNICEKISSKDSRIKILNKKNGGLSDARNYGLKHSKGEYIYFIDSDDWCEQELIEKMIQKMINTKSDLGICDYWIDYVNDNFSLKKECKCFELYTKNEIPEAIYLLDKSGMFNVVWNKMYKRNLIIKNNISFELDGMPGEDLLFNVDYFKYTENICFIDEKLYHYMRQDETTLVNKYNEKLYLQVKRFNKARKSLYNYYNMNEDRYKQVYETMYISYILSCIPNLYRSNNLSFKIRNKELQKLKADKYFKKYIQRNNSLSGHSNVFVNVFKINNINCINLILMVLFYCRNKFFGLYRKFRKIVFIRGN